MVKFFKLMSILTLGSVIALIFTGFGFILAGDLMQTGQSMGLAGILLLAYVLCLCGADSCKHFGDK